MAAGSGSGTCHSGCDPGEEARKEASTALSVARRAATLAAAPSCTQAWWTRPSTNQLGWQVESRPKMSRSPSACRGLEV